VDRKCVWRLCAIKSGEDVAHLLISGVADQKVFNLAVESLDRSAALRHGSHKVGRTAVIPYHTIS
jgi:hypothetical protein